MASTTMSGWRAAADPDDLREYDRFGPWIDKVQDLSDMPRRFRPWWPELEGADYVLKVPRHYDRAQVRPGMDLYESVIAVDRDRLCVLRAEVGEVVRRDVARGDVVASIRHSNLLYGRWSLLLADGDRLDMEFNTVSQATVAEVDRFLMSSGEGRSTVTAAPVDRPQNHFFGSIITALNAEEPSRVRLVHVEEPDEPCLTDRNRRRRSTGAMILHTPDELLIFNRDAATRSLFRRTNYAFNIVRVPFRRMTSFELHRAQPASPARFSHLVLTCDRQRIVQAVLTPPDDVADLLSAYGVPCRPSDRD